MKRLHILLRANLFSHNIDAGFHLEFRTRFLDLLTTVTVDVEDISQGGKIPKQYREAFFQLSAFTPRAKYPNSYKIHPKISTHHCHFIGKLASKPTTANHSSSGSGGI